MCDVISGEVGRGDGQMNGGKNVIGAWPKMCEQLRMIYI